MNNITLLLNKKSKYYSELESICVQGYKVISTSNFSHNLDVMIQCKPKQIICVINGSDLLFEWKRNKELDRIKTVSQYFKHSYVIIIIKHNLELQKANKIFNNVLDILDINIQLMYVNNLNEAVRFFGFIYQKINKFNINNS